MTIPSSRVVPEDSPPSHLTDEIQQLGEDVHESFGSQSMLTQELTLSQLEEGSPPVEDVSTPSPKLEPLSAQRVGLVASDELKENAVAEKKEEDPESSSSNKQDDSLLSQESDFQPLLHAIDFLDNDDRVQSVCAWASKAIDDPHHGKELLLHMALTREDHNYLTSRLTKPTTNVIPERFYWANYPTLEKVLQDNMKEYYDLSIRRKQSQAQIDFNKALVSQIQETADQHGLVFCRHFQNETRLRDRIRCYFKTHIQNAKKRLKTILKNPEKKANRKHILQHLDEWEALRLQS